MSWYTKFGLRANPFTTDPFEGDFTMVNYTHLVEELLYLTRAGRMVSLSGPDGSGKTTMLVQIIRNFGGKGNVLYIDGASFPREFDIEKELNSKGRSWFKKVKGDTPQGLIVLLDNADQLSGINAQKLKYFFDQDFVRSVIFTGPSFESMPLSASIRDRIGDAQLVIPPMINYDALRIIRNRFSDHFFLPDEMILKLFTTSKGNIKQLLVNCERVSEYVVNQGKGEVLPRYVRIALKKTTSKATSKKSSSKSKPKSKSKSTGGSSNDKQATA